MVKASLIGAGLLALTAVRADAAVIPLNATDVWTSAHPVVGAAYANNGLYASNTGTINVLNPNAIALGPTSTYSPRGPPVSDLASVDGKLAQLVNNRAYITDIAGNELDNIAIGTGIVGIGGTKIGADSYITWVKGDGTYGALNIATRANQTIGTITGMPSDATGMDSYLAVGGTSLADIVYGVCNASSNIFFFRNGQLQADHYVVAGGLDGTLRDIAFEAAGGNQLTLYGATDATTFTPAGEAFRAASTITMVPEPASLGLLAIAACGLLGRRHRRDH